MDHRGPKHVHGVNHAVDQARRLHEFAAAHPEVTFLLPRETASGWHKAIWPSDGGHASIERQDLRELLDEMDRQFGEVR